MSDEGAWFYTRAWRAEAVRLALQVENLEHEVGVLTEKLRRIAGYVNSAWREDTGNDHGWDRLLAP